MKANRTAHTPPKWPRLTDEQEQDIRLLFYQALAFNLQPQTVTETKVTRKSPAKETDLPTEEIITTTKLLPPDPKVIQMAALYLASSDAASHTDGPSNSRPADANANDTHADELDDYPPFEQWLNQWQAASTSNPQLDESECE